MAQVVAHIIGNDEVTSSNLVSSSYPGSFLSFRDIFVLLFMQLVSQAVILKEYLIKAVIIAEISL